MVMLKKNLTLDNGNYKIKNSCSESFRTALIFKKRSNNFKISFMNKSNKKKWFILGLFLIIIIISIWFFEKGEELGTLIAK